MAELDITDRWDDGTNVGVRCVEVVSVRGVATTLIYEATTPKAGKTLPQLRAALAGQIKAQRDAKRASLAVSQDIDLGSTTLTVN